MAETADRVERAADLQLLLTERGPGIKALGFGDEEAVSYLVQHLLPATLRGKIDDLKTAGFSNPVKSIEKHPQLAGYDIERVVGDLKTAGFSNPVKSIEKHPQLAGYDIERVKRKIRLIQHLNNQFHLSSDPINIIEAFPTYLSYKISRLFFYLRVAAFYALDEKNYKNLIKKNPFLIFSLLYPHPAPTPEALMKSAKSLARLPKEEKQRRINEVKNHLPEWIEALNTLPDPEEKTFLAKLAKNLTR